MFEIGQLVVCDGYIRFISEIHQDNTISVFNLWSPEKEERVTLTQTILPNAKYSQWHEGLIKAANRVFPTFIESGNKFFVRYPETIESH